MVDSGHEAMHCCQSFLPVSSLTPYVLAKVSCKLCFSTLSTVQGLLVNQAPELFFIVQLCRQYFDAVGWAAGRAFGL